VHVVSALQDLAESYVLGLLDTTEAAAVEARIARPSGVEDRALAAAVGSARDMLLPLDLTATVLPLGPGAWSRVEARLGAQDDVAAVPGAVRPAPPAGAAPPPSGGGWRLAALVATAAAVVLAALLGWQTLLAPKPAVLVVLVDDGGVAVAVLEAFDDNRVVVTPLRGVEAGPSQVLQLWTKPDPDGPPVSVGLLQTVARMAVRNPDLPQPADGQLYEITLEPEGGSPTGLPTGPVVGVGNAQAPVLGDG
jgi:anti-sigma-K factor RskA